MSAASGIEWTDATWNPVTGCSKVSPGCAHCYAERDSRRWGRTSAPWTPANAAANVQLHPERLQQPLHWRKPRRVFVNSMSDLFHEQVPDWFILEAWLVMAMAQEHTFQVLTKRPERMRAWLRSVQELPGGHQLFADSFWPLPNVWLGVSAENQRWADERIRVLLDTPATVRFVSLEPLLGPIDLPGRPRDERWRCLVCGEGREEGHELVHGQWQGGEDWSSHVYRTDDGLDWVIVGGESGPRARAMDPAWASDLLAQCRAAGVPFFMKQMGGLRPGGALPAELDVREWPTR